MYCENCVRCNQKWSYTKKCVTILQMINGRFITFQCSQRAISYQNNCMCSSTGKIETFTNMRLEGRSGPKCSRNVSFLGLYISISFLSSVKTGRNWCVDMFAYCFFAVWNWIFDMCHVSDRNQTSACICW